MKVDLDLFFCKQNGDLVKMNAEVIALQQVVSLLLHSLPDSKKAEAYKIIESIKAQDYESSLLNSEANITPETASLIAQKIKDAYSQVIKTSRYFDDLYN